MTEDTIRPTKKQRELLGFVERFIAEYGYGPSYREIMRGCGYNSVATVALHINSLITRGHLVKRDRSARSLELVKPSNQPKLPTNQLQPSEEKWLIDKVDHLLRQAEQSPRLDPHQLEELYVLIGALKILGLPEAAQSFIPRLTSLKSKPLQ